MSTWQSFDIGRGSSEISRWKKRKKERKETSAVKHKTAGNYRSGRPNKLTHGIVPAKVWKQTTNWISVVQGRIKILGTEVFKDGRQPEIQELFTPKANSCCGSTNCRLQAHKWSRHERRQHRLRLSYVHLSRRRRLYETTTRKLRTRTGYWTRPTRFHNDTPLNTKLHQNCQNTHVIASKHCY